MTDLISALRSVIGEASFYVNGELDYSLLIEYIIASLVVLCVVCNIFKLLRVLCGK